MISWLFAGLILGFAVGAWHSRGVSHELRAARAEIVRLRENVAMGKQMIEVLAEQVQVQTGGAVPPVVMTGTDDP